MRIDMISEHASPLTAIGGADSGGQNVHVAELARALGARGHHVTVYTRRDDPEVPDRVRAGPGVTVEHVPAGPATSLPKDALLPYMDEFGDHLARRWLTEPPDVVHAHFWMSGLAAHRGARQARDCCAEDLGTGRLGRGLLGTHGGPVPRAPGILTHGATTH